MSTQSKHSKQGIGPAIRAWRKGGKGPVAREELASKTTRRMSTIRDWEKDPKHEVDSNLANIRRRFGCDETDAVLIRGHLLHAEQSGSNQSYGPPARIEDHELFEDDAGLDLATLETALLLTDGALLLAYRRAYRQAYRATDVVRSYH